MAKMTKKERFTIIKGIVENSVRGDRQELIEFLDNEIQLLSNKTGKSKNSGVQKVNEVLMERVLEVMADFARPVTITELMQDARLATYTVEVKDKEKTEIMSSQKLAAIVKKLLDNKAVVRTVEKKKAYFSLKKEEAEDTPMAPDENEV